MTGTLPNPARLRVAIVAPSLGILGGQAVQANRLLHAWTGDPEVDAWLVPIDPPAPGPLRWLQRVKYARTVATQLTYWPRLAAALRRADVVHVFSASYFSFVLAPWPAVRVARWLGKPIVFNYRSGEAPDHLRRSPLARRTLRAVDLNVVPSRFLHEVFAAHDIPSRIVPNVVDVERFLFRPRRPLRPVLLSTRNFEPLYNVACTMRAFRLVQDRYPEARLTLVGGGSEEPRLRALVESLGLRNVTFAGRIPPHQIWQAYEAGDIYVQTPNIDNMPASILEAWASGLPVVATEAGGVPAILRHERQGLLTPLDDPQSVARAVLRLLEEPGLAERLALEARRSCETYSWAHVRPLWIDAYRTVLRSAFPGRVPVPSS